MTLTQAATLTRRTVLLTIILTTLAIGGAVGYNLWQKYYLSTLPPREVKPEMKFGTLPQVNFPTSEVSSSNFSYSLDTVTGGLPQTPKLLKVYFIPRMAISLLAPEKSRMLAQSLGFSSSSSALSEDEYQFTDNMGGELKISLTSGNFHLQRKIASSSATISTTEKNEEGIVNEFKSYLTSKGLFPDDLKNGRSNVTFPNTSKTPIAQVSLWPMDIDNLRLITANFNHGLVQASVLLLPTDTPQEKFSKIDYVFWVVDQSTFSTYPLKTADQAFADLRSGLGFISIEPKAAQVSISSVYLAYFYPEGYSPYLQPVFVFEGPGFAALVPAISS